MARVRLCGTPFRVGTVASVALALLIDVAVALDRAPFRRCTMLIEKLDRYKEWEGRYLNSHSESLHRYRRMLEVYSTIKTPPGGRPPLDDIQRILAADRA